MQKSAVRELIRFFRKSYNLEYLERLSLIICKHIEKLAFYQKTQKIIYYYPKDGEVSLLYLIGKAFLEKKVYLPKTWVQQKKLTFHQVYSFSDLRPGPFGLLEPPVEHPKIELGDIELIFVPGLAFDLKGGRIGYGGGFYDRVLSQIKGKKIGVAFSFQVFNKLSLEPHDCKVDFLVTEKGVWACNP
ncbi:5-formyltetrahydrofolate cyclo-ligase [Thermodesulfobacterium hveragerdense]|uniref:5-formyltetrahydrofolate cyclo-ligase n=1 Tax=Thermodesulfobacterium hveragerdense TaxID=53424 RepID=UPI00048F6E13|nr:5-formyltetrahydrofolate cyclo-ligase [Thermodesulfobacterium hveragerdense]